MTTASADLPLHLAGNNSPVTEEVTAVPTSVVGAVPRHLSGLFLRNGPNPRTGWSPHLFAGDGMVHGVAIEDGTARWYRNRYVRTPLYARPGATRGELAFDPATGRLDHRVTAANTHVIAHAGRILALEEGGLPYELTSELDTVGPHDFDGALQTAMTAHPKACPVTGELLFFGYSIAPPFLTYHRASPDGALVASREVPVQRPTMMHDFAITTRHVIFFDTPIVFDRTLAAAGMPPWRWDDDHGARFGVLPRDDETAPVRWFGVEPAHVSHTMNAHEVGDTIVITGTRIASMWRDGSDDMGGSLPVLHEWRLELTTGAVSEAPLDDSASEYPRVADHEVGRDHRHGYTTSFVLEAEPDHSEIYRYDLTDGAARTVHRFPVGHTCGEPVFVPGEGSSGDGYLLTFAHDRARGTSYLTVLDAGDLGADPVAEIHVPVRVPGGFHGSWIAHR